MVSVRAHHVPSPLGMMLTLALSVTPCEKPRDPKIVPRVLDSLSHTLRDGALVPNSLHLMEPACIVRARSYQNSADTTDPWD